MDQIEERVEAMENWFETDGCIDCGRVEELENEIADLRQKKEYLEQEIREMRENNE
jgi:hypothetical protein